MSRIETHELTLDNDPEIWAILQPYMAEHAAHLDRVHDGYCYHCQAWIEDENAWRARMQELKS